MRKAAAHATTRAVTVSGAQIAASAASPDALRDWETLRRSGDLQFAPLPPAPPVPPPPDWLQILGKWLEAALEPLGRWLGVSWPAIQNALIALGVLLVLFLLWVLVGRPLLERLRNRPGPTDDGAWLPDRGEAMALLDEADRLAGQGDFAQAVHLLLQRSVRQIADARPDWLLPASTAREISGLAQLPGAARNAFAVIAARVERSRFALRPLDEGDWRAARAAYADFALTELRV